MMRRLTFTALMLLFVPQFGFAQDSSHWGVIGSVTPSWKVPAQLEQLFDGTVDIQGMDVSIGVARGRTLGGDWGVSFIHKALKDGSRVESISQDCTRFTNGCFQEGESVITRGVAINGLEVHKFVPFVTIRQRVQIGMNFAGGFGKFSGTLEKHKYQAETITFNPRTGRQTDTVTTEPASELIPLSIVPLVKVQVAVAAIVAPAFKIRVQGGLDFPGYEYVSVVGVVLFGAR